LPKRSENQPKWFENHPHGSWSIVQKGMEVLEEVDVDVDSVKDVEDVDDVVVDEVEVVEEVDIEVEEVTSYIAVTVTPLVAAYDNAITTNNAIEKTNTEFDTFLLIPSHLIIMTIS